MPFVAENFNQNHNHSQKSWNNCKKNCKSAIEYIWLIFRACCKWRNKNSDVVAISVNEKEICRNFLVLQGPPWSTFLVFKTIKAFQDIWWTLYINFRFLLKMTCLLFYIWLCSIGINGEIRKNEIPWCPFLNHQPTSNASLVS